MRFFVLLFPIELLCIVKPFHTCSEIVENETRHLFNVSFSSGDRTSTGHVLGQPNTRPITAVPERTMSPVVLSVVRLLMHSAMIMGACTHPAVCWNTVLIGTVGCLFYCNNSSSKLYTSFTLYLVHIMLLYPTLDYLMLFILPYFAWRF